jgi:hypothetical protein
VTATTRESAGACFDEKLREQAEARSLSGVVILSAEIAEAGMGTRFRERRSGPSVETAPTRTKDMPARAARSIGVVEPRRAGVAAWQRRASSAICTARDVTRARAGRGRL